MVAFLDIAEEAQTATVPLRGKDVEVHGMSSRQIARLLLHFRKLEALLAGQVTSMAELIDIAPDAVCAIIAYGTGYDDREDKALFDRAMAKADKLHGGEQTDMVKGIFRVTFGDRLDPFVKGLWPKILARIEAAADKVDGANGKVRSLKSLLQSRDSLLSATTPEMFGDTRPPN